MALKDVLKDIEGYTRITEEIRTLRKYGSDFTDRKGEVERMIAMLHPKTVPLVVSEIVTETTSTRTFRLTARGGHLPPFQAGQYINVFLEVGGVRTSRPYSISSSPTETGFYDITIRSVADGFVSSWVLEEARVGDAFESTSPSGTFTYNPLFHGTTSCSWQAAAA
jgi:NAD(P)H-flavin reductase